MWLFNVMLSSHISCDDYYIGFEIETLLVKRQVGGARWNLVKQLLVKALVQITIVCIPLLDSLVSSPRQFHFFYSE